VLSYASEYSIREYLIELVYPQYSIDLSALFLIQMVYWVYAIANLTKGAIAVIYTPSRHFEYFFWQPE